MVCTVIFEGKTLRYPALFFVECIELELSKFITIEYSILVTAFAII